MPFLTNTTESQRILARMRRRITFASHGDNAPTPLQMRVAWHLLRENRETRRAALTIRPTLNGPGDAA